MAEFFSKQNVNGIIIPSSLLVVGTLIVKKEWAPWACLLAAIMSGWKLFSTSTSCISLADSHHICQADTNIHIRSQARIEAN